MNKFAIAGFAVLCLAPIVLPRVLATTDEFPTWAYPVNPPPAPGAPRAPKDDGTLLHVPDSDVALTRSQIEGAESVPDWHPNDHPAMPDIVKNGRENVRACAYCHQPSGVGRPENASLAGLTQNYIGADRNLQERRAQRLRAQARPAEPDESDRCQPDRG